MRDRLLLTALVLLTCAPSVADLGFYSDDWSALGWFALAPDDSIPALCRSIASPIIVMRPVQILNMALAYRAFGTEPLGYHLVNAGVLVAGVLLFHEALRLLGAGRFLSLSVPAVYGLLPHATTVRVWILSPSIAFSLAAYFLSLVADLRAARAAGWSGGAWKALALASLGASVLAYEAAMPLFLVNALLVARRSSWIQGLVTAAPLLPLGLFKAATTIRLPGGSAGAQARDLLATAIRLDYGPHDYGFNLWEALRVAFGTYGWALPRTVAEIAGHGVETAALVTSLVVGVVAYLGLRAAARDGIPGPRTMARTAGAGLAVFLLGYAIFLTNWNVQITPTGLANRTAAAAAIGVALTLVGVLGWIASRIPSPRLLPALVAAVCAANAFVVLGIVRFWEEAWPRERAILATLQRALPDPPPGSSVLLDGTCPYHGPAIVFESSWDIRGALMRIHRDPTLRADVVTSRTEVREEGVVCSLYDAEQVYPYGRLFVVDARSGTVRRLPSAAEARDWLRTRPDPGCPPGFEGKGVEILSPAGPRP